MSECTHNCETCSANCSSKEESLIAPSHEMSQIKKVIGVVSGKGGVGKSTVASLLAVTMQRRGFSSAVLDADVTGPSIPKMFGVKEKAEADESGIYAGRSKTGIKLMSVNMLLENDSDPVVWRGPVIGGVVKQFWTDVIWEDVDFMFVDMPPGTGDVPLTVFQSLPVDGIIIVTSPSELVSMIVSKAVKMAKLMNIPVLGIVENMSYFECPDCKKRYEIFGKSNVNEIAENFGINVIAKIPIDSRLANAADKGAIELFEGDWLEDIANVLENA